MRHPNRRIATAAAALALLALAFAASAQAATKPVLTIEDASQVTAFGAKLSGTVDPGGASTSCRFLFVTEARFQASGFENLTYGNYVSCDVNPLTGSGARAVSAQITLRPNTTYHFALEATNQAGTSFLEDANTFTTPAVPPEVTTGPNTPFPGGNVHLLGYVDPEESPVSACKFVYGPAENDYPQEAPCENHPGDEVQALHIAAIGGQFRLLFEGQETSDLPYDATATQVQSALEALPAIGAGGVSVTRPVQLSDYRLYMITFEGALADADVGELEGKGGTQPLEVGSGQGATVETLSGGGLSAAKEVTTRLTGLTPGVTYHYRLVAETGSGQAESEDAVFKAAEEAEGEGPCPDAGALGAAFLPECRAWEMVSPPAKNGGDVIVRSALTRIAADGSAASFASPSPFGETSGAGVDSEYESVRTPEGWKTHGIFPKQPDGTFHLAAELATAHYEGDFSPDMERGAVMAVAPLDHSDPYVEEVINLYLRTDLRSPGPGTYRLLTRCPLCAEKGKALEGLGGIRTHLSPEFVAATPGLEHVVFSSVFNLVKPANSAAAKLYENEEGALRLVGILPNGAAASTSAPAITLETITGRDMSSDGSKVFWSDGTNVYMRLDHETTVQINESELPVSEGDGTAIATEATPDGSKIFFTDSARLSEDAPEGGGTYVYDTTKPASDPHNLSFVGSGTAFAASADGETVYLRGGGTEDPSDPSLYVWHGGKLRLLGSGRYIFGGLPLQNEFGDPPRGYRVSAGGQLLFAAGDRPLGLTGQSPGYCRYNAGKACVAFYTYDPATEALQCVTCPSGGGEGQMSILSHNFNSGLGYFVRRANDNPISVDGRHVFFSTNAALVPEDTDGVTDAYTFDTATAQVSLISHGTDPYPSYFIGATSDGSNALFTTRQPLSGWDFDTNNDVYDARVDGGLPEPPPVPAACEGESCREPAIPVPSPSATSSESLLGPGNPRPNRPKKHRHKKHHRRHHRGGHR